MADKWTKYDGGMYGAELLGSVYVVAAPRPEQGLRGYVLRYHDGRHESFRTLAAAKRAASVDAATRRLAAELNSPEMAAAIVEPLDES